MMMEEMCFQVSLENVQGFSTLDMGGKFLPPAGNAERKYNILYNISLKRPIIFEDIWHFALYSITKQGLH